MSLLFLLKKIVSVLILPPVMPLLLSVVGLAIMHRRPRTGRWLAWGGVLLALGFCTSATVALLLAPLEAVPVLQAEEAKQGGAIVILGAGARSYQPEYAGPVPNRLALERLRYGARLARSTGLPVLLTGGAPTGKVPEAELMAASLREDFGVMPRWLEVASLDTADNARMTAAILHRENVRRIVLVTHAAHMKRSIGEFSAVGFEVIPAPTGFLYDPHDAREMFFYLPGASAAYNGWYAAHEWVGLLAQKIRLMSRLQGSP